MRFVSMYAKERNTTGLIVHNKHAVLNKDHEA